MGTSKEQAEANILTFLRIKPSKSPSGYFNVDELDNDCALAFSLPDNFKSDYVNNSKLKHNFRFNGVIDAKASQDDVFKKVGVAAVQNAIDGFNSTIFAYGQTGSGKTFTLTGGPEKYTDRGIIPRSISMLFKEFRNRADMQFKVYISYLEIYNDKGYDLLDASHETKALEELPKIVLLEDEHGNFHLKNLSMHLAESEEDALNLLFTGETNRAVAETPMNMASSRSHCIFSLSLEAKLSGGDKIRRSKLHLVDLAGSERVAKTNSSGSVLTEAKYINGSLFFLEMVIVALYEKATKGRAHVPYRNSMMTSVLRDSLGGNCKTIMIATINPESSHTDESLSTCRFAQRVSLIKNKAEVNEEVDPSMVIRRLKGEMLNLREEISFLKGESGEGDVLTPQALEDLRSQCRTYCYDMDPNSVLNIGALTLTKIKDAFAIMKNFVLENFQKSRLPAESSPRNGSGPSGGESDQLQKQVKDLKSLLLQRDNEIAILVNMVKKGKTADDVISGSSSSSSGRTSQLDGSSSFDAKPAGSTQQQTKMPMSSQQLKNQQQQQQQLERQEKVVKRHLFGVPPPTDKNIFEDGAASFEWFRERCSMNSSLDENKELLKDRITEAKTVGERANQSRNTITYLKNSIESIRRERAMQKINSENSDGKEEVDDETPEETTYRRAIEQEKVVYKESFERLKVLKPEIEHIKKVIEKCRQQIQTQFDQWYNNLHSRGALAMSDSSNSVGAHLSNYAAGDKSPAQSSSDYSTSKSNNLYGSNNNSTSQQRGGNSNNIPSTVLAEAKTSNAAVDGDVNEDILAFYQAKEELLRRRGAER